MKQWIISGVLAAAMLLAGCAGQGTGPMQGGSAASMPQACQEAGSGMQEQAYHKITAEEAKQMMDEGGVTVVDVRTEAEYKEGHIPGAVRCPTRPSGASRPKRCRSWTPCCWCTAAQGCAASRLRISWWGWDTPRYMILAVSGIGPTTS